jgi:capsid protein
MSSEQFYREWEPQSLPEVCQTAWAEWDRSCAYIGVLAANLLKVCDVGATAI